MKTILVAVVLGLAACGGTEQKTPDFQGQWAIRFGDVGGTVTLAPKATSEITGSWNFGSAGQGEVFGNVESTTVEVVFTAPDHSIVADANVVVGGNSITGIARTNTGDMALTGYRLSR